MPPADGHLTWQPSLFAPLRSWNLNLERALVSVEDDEGFNWRNEGLQRSRTTKG